MAVVRARQAGREGGGEEVSWTDYKRSRLYYMYGDEVGQQILNIKENIKGYGHHQANEELLQIEDEKDF